MLHCLHSSFYPLHCPRMSSDITVWSQLYHVPCVDACCCHVWLSLIGFGGVALSRFTLSRLTVVPNVSLMQPEDSFALFSVIGQETCE